MKAPKFSLNSLVKQWLNPLKDHLSGAPKHPQGPTKQLASAALLIEVMKMDGCLSDSEQKMLTQRLVHHFSLDINDVLELTTDANVELEKATDYYQFTRALNQQLSISEKLDLVESLWLMAAADGRIDANENHLIRKIADLLHLRRSEFVTIKDKVLKH